MYYLFVLIILNVASVFCNLDDEHRCCPADQYLVTNDTISLCFDPKAYVTKALSLECGNLTTFVAKSELNYYVNNHGQLVQPFQYYEKEVDSGQYCLGTQMSWKNRSIVRPVAVLCDEPERVVPHAALACCMIVSSVFLSLTAVVYTALPELRDLQGMSIINLCVSLGLGLAFLAMLYLMTYSTSDADMALCAVRGFLAYFFILSAFFWMNVLSIQIFLRIRKPLNSTHACKEFAAYVAYAWGVPVLLTIAMAVVNYIPGEHFRPGIGLNNCWFYEKQQWRWMYSVMSILTVVNVCIFVYTLILLWKHTYNSKQHKVVRYRFGMTVRLAVVMGLPWIFEMLGSLTTSHILWEILDIINTLQGVLIFVVVVVLRRRTVQCMLRHGWLRCVEGPVERYLARGDNAEDEAEHTTLGVPLDTLPQ